MNIGRRCAVIINSICVEALLFCPSQPATHHRLVNDWLIRRVTYNPSGCITHAKWDACPEPENLGSHATLRDSTRFSFHGCLGTNNTSLSAANLARLDGLNQIGKRVDVLLLREASEPLKQINDLVNHLADLAARLGLPPVNDDAIGKSVTDHLSNRLFLHLHRRPV